jgi:hypothetical protein
MEIQFYCKKKISPDLIAIKNKMINNNYKSSDIEFLQLKKDKNKFESILTSDFLLNLEANNNNEEKNEKNEKNKNDKNDKKNMKLPLINNLNSSNLFEKGLKISSLIKQKFDSKYFNS